MYDKNPKKRDDSTNQEPEAGGPPAAPEEGGTTGGPPAAEGAPYTPPSASPIPAVSPEAVAQGKEKKLVAGILGILLGCLGIHKFYLGYTNEGLIMLLVTVLGGGVGGAITCGLLAPVAFVPWVIGLVEGILYLTKSDEEFAATYIVGKKPWF